MTSNSNLTTAPTSRGVNPLELVLNFLRGGLIGMAELVPGISGGTLALITGVYVRLIDAADHVISAAKTLVTGPDRVKGMMVHLRKVDWWLIIPLIVGMGVIVVSMAGVMSSFVTNHPEPARGLFFGMVFASLAVPLLLIDDRDLKTPTDKLKAFAVVAVVGMIFFFVTGMGGAANNPSPSYILVFFAAAIAICALVLPGVSGSFFLLTIGIYAATTGAVHDMNLPYIAVFAAGALTGLALFVKGLHFLLHHHHTWTMLFMTGLMVGSLRALWPWMDDDRTLHGVGDNWLLIFGLMLLGVIIVAALIAADRLLPKKGAPAPAASQS